MNSRSSTYGSTPEFLPLPGESHAIAAKSAVGCFTFGSLLPGRNYNSGSYRHLFQGQEHDDEINGAVGTSYAFEYRIHDPRIGRFLSIDPLASRYPWNSPYAFAENKVIQFVELEGLETAESGANSGGTETTEQKLDRVRAQYDEVVARGREEGFNVAADLLQTFLDGKAGGEGAEVRLNPNWLRGFGAVQDAESRNQSRFEDQIGDRAAQLKDGQSVTFTDYWDAQETAGVRDELYYASGTSSVKTTATITLTRSGDVVAVTGQATVHWYDPYDWHAGLGARIPGMGNIKDEDALFMQEHGGAAPFMMTGTWSSPISGSVTVRNYWFDDVDVNWGFESSRPW